MFACKTKNVLFSLIGLLNRSTSISISSSPIASTVSLTKIALIGSTYNLILLDNNSSSHKIVVIASVLDPVSIIADAEFLLSICTSIFRKFSIFKALTCKISGNEGMFKVGLFVSCLESPFNNLTSEESPFLIVSSLGITL